MPLRQNSEYFEHHEIKRYQVMYCSLAKRWYGELGANFYAELLSAPSYYWAVKRERVLKYGLRREHKWFTFAPSASKNDLLWKLWVEPRLTRASSTSLWSEQKASSRRSVAAAAIAAGGAIGGSPLLVNCSERAPPCRAWRRTAPGAMRGPTASISAGDASLLHYLRNMLKGNLSFLRNKFSETDIHSNLRMFDRFIRHRF